MSVILDAFYSLLYFTGCGKATVASVCPECKEFIGGAEHKALAGNTRVDEKPITRVNVQGKPGIQLEKPSTLHIHHSVRYFFNPQ